MDAGHSPDLLEGSAAPEPLESFPVIAGGLRSSVTRQVLTYWRQLSMRVGGGLPPRDLLDPADISARLLPHLFLCEFLDDGGVLIRLQGSYLADRAGQALSRRRIDHESFGENAGSILRIYDAVKRHRRPFATHQQVLTSLGTTIVSEVLHLPMGKDSTPNSPVAFVLGALDRIDNVAASTAGQQATEWSSIQVLQSF